MTKPEYTVEEILLLLERARMLDIADRLRVLWYEKQREIDFVRDDAAFMIRQKMKEREALVIHKEYL